MFRILHHSTSKMDVGYAKPQGDVSENRRASIFGVGIGFIVFDSIVISLRFYVRGFMLRALGTDDSKSTKGNLRLRLTIIKF